MLDQDNIIEKLKYPVGKFKTPAEFSESNRHEAIEALRMLPLNLKAEIEELSEEQLDTPYRAGGWSVRQLMHHIADSHMNSFMRFKLALTEDNPTIKPYDQDGWVQMEESKILNPMISIKILEGIHERLVYILKRMSEEEFGRTLYHPEMKKNLSLDAMLALYGWHSRHHLAHITALKKRKAW